MDNTPRTYALFLTHTHLLITHTLTLTLTLVYPYHSDAPASPEQTQKLRECCLKVKGILSVVNLQASTVTDKG